MTALTSASMLAMALLLASTGQVAAATIEVDNDRGECPAAEHTRIDVAVAAAGPGDTIIVCPGTYTAENVVIVDANLTLLGARSGDDFEGRTFGDATESTVQGTIRIAAEGAKVDGFSMTNPGLNSVVTVDVLGNGALITNNIIHVVGSETLAVPATAVYLEQGPDGVDVTDNWISTIRSSGGSAQGVLVGDSVSTDPSLDIVIANNLIEDLVSGRGAYGIQVNNGASTAPAAIGYAEVEIRDNLIRDLSGSWVHAIGLEGPTPDAIVFGNSITDIGAGDDHVAVHLEDNPDFPSVDVHENNFDVTAAAYGIKLHPELVASHGTEGSVDGECNWWDSANGPGPIGPGDGARVSTNVDFSPWLERPAPGAPCRGGIASDRDVCKDGGWEESDEEFKNQGQCIKAANSPVRPADRSARPAPS